MATAGRYKVQLEVGRRRREQGAVVTAQALRDDSDEVEARGDGVRLKSQFAGGFVDSESVDWLTVVLSVTILKRGTIEIY